MMCLADKDCVSRPVEGTGLCSKHLEERRASLKVPVPESTPAQPAQPPPVRLHDQTRGDLLRKPQPKTPEPAVHREMCWCGREKGHRGMHRNNQAKAPKAPIVKGPTQGTDTLSRFGNGNGKLPTKYRGKSLKEILSMLNAERTEIEGYIESVETVIRLSSELGL